MAWIKNNTLKNKNSMRENINSSVRISFRFMKNKKNNKELPSLSIYLGDHIANKIGIKENDKVDFFIDDQNSRKWLIKKSDSIDEGYKLSKQQKNGKSPNFSKFQLTFHKADISLSEKDLKIRTVKHDIDHGGIVVFAD